MEGNRRDEEEIQDDLVVEVVLMVNFPLVPFLLVSFPCSSCADDFPAKKKVNNHIVEMQKDPTSCLKTIEKKLLVRHSFKNITSLYTSEAPDHLSPANLPCYPA